MTETRTVAVSEIIFRDDLYPRMEKHPVTVQKYAEDLAVLPPIEINQRNELIDGWHRWTAYKKVGEEQIPVTITETTGDGHLLELAIRRNAAHGLQLSQEDKRNMARQIYHVTPERERDAKKKALAEILSVSERTVRDWLSRIDKDSKEVRARRIFDLWLGCYTMEEIGEAVGLHVRDKALQVSRKLEDLPNNEKSAAIHATEFDPPIYNIWKQQTKTPGSSHFGNTEVQLVDNLLYLYTKPFDVVVDPFGGGGSTVDLCKKRLRRYWVSDRKVEPEQEGRIRLWDVTDGLPKLPRWKDVSLVYLDPPYWKQAEGKYSDDETDLANMPLDEFTKVLSGLVKSFAGKLRPGAVIALIIQPTQWRAPDREYTDHVADMLRAVKVSVDMRFSCPYESQQCTAQMVEWAKANKKCLVLTRELIVWRT